MTAARLTPPPKPTGLRLVDGLAALGRPTLHDYLGAVSEYVLNAAQIGADERKAGQLRLSTALGRVLLEELRARVTLGPTARAGEHDISGALRQARVDVSEMHELDGLRLAIEIKPVNLAVGRAIWNRFGDVRVTAVNVHLKFPYAVVGGLLTMPTWEEVKRRRKGQIFVERKSTADLVHRLLHRLDRAGGRRTEGDAPHLLEAAGVVVYDPDHATLAAVPSPDTPFSWDGFLRGLAESYSARFGDPPARAHATEDEGDGDEPFGELLVADTSTDEL